MIIKDKICKGKGQAVEFGCGRLTRIFGHGLCPYCYQKFKRSTYKPKTKKLGDKKPEVNLNELYYEIWQERKHVSFLSGEKLDKFVGTDYFRNMFAHVLAKGKGKYPRFKSYKKNIVLLTPEEHHLFDNGTKKQRQEYADRTGCDWSKLYDLMDELKDEYKRL